MENVKNNIDATAEELAWECFQKTGNVGFYLLHKNIGTVN